MARAQSVTIHRKSPTTPVTTEFPDVIKGNGTYNTVTLQYGLHVAVQICCVLGVSSHKWNCFFPVCCSRWTTAPQTRSDISHTQLMLWLQRKFDAIGKVISQLRDEGACEPSGIRFKFQRSNLNSRPFIVTPFSLARQCPLHPSRRRGITITISAARAR